MAKYKIEIYKDRKGKFHWRRTAANGEIVGASKGGFVSKSACSTNEKNAVVVGWKSSEKISQIEGHKLSRSMNGIFREFSSRNSPHDERHATLKELYGKPKR